MALQLRKELGGKWETIRGFLKDDLDAIETELNLPTDLSEVTGSISPAAMPSFPPGTLIGRGTASGVGPPEAITIGPGLQMTGTLLTAGGPSSGSSGGGIQFGSGECECSGPIGPPGTPSTPTLPGGVSGDYQYNNGSGGFAGGVLKQPAADIIEQVDGTTTQEARFYNTTSGGGANYERLTTKVANDFFGESAYSFIAQKLGTGADKGIAFNAPGSISFTIPGANPTIVMYHDPTSAGGISFIPNGSAFVGVIYCDQSGAYMQTPGGFGVAQMLDIIQDNPKAFLIGQNPSGSDFIFRFLTFDSSNALRVISVGNATGLGSSTSGTVFAFDSALTGVVASLPATAPLSSVLYVVDALAPVIGSAVVGGGGVFAAVMWNGAQWTVFSV